jgi:hypothetical protein
MEIPMITSLCFKTNRTFTTRTREDIPTYRKDKKTLGEVKQREKASNITFYNATRTSM